MKRNVLELDAKETIASAKVTTVKVKKRKKKRAKMNKKTHNHNQNHVLRVKDTEVAEVVMNAVVVAAAEVVAAVVVAILAMANLVVIVVVIVVVVEGEEEVEVVEKKEKMGRDRKTRVATTHSRVKSRVMVQTNSRTEILSQLAPKLETKFRKAKSRELQKLLDRTEERKVSLEVKEGLSVVVEVAEEVVEGVAEEVGMAHRKVILLMRQSKPKIDNSEDPSIQTGVIQSEVTP